VGGFILPAAVALMCLASPAVAVPGGAGGFLGQVSQPNPPGGGDEGYGGHGRPGGKPQPPGPVPGACTAVDSTQPNGSEEYLGALFNGVPFAGKRDVTPNPENTVITSGPTNAPGWDDLSDITGFPTDFPVCDISVDANGDEAFYKIITLDGDVFTLHCDGSGQTLVCPAGPQGRIPASEWRQVTELPNSS
jgi:hypothetical protein